MDTTSALTAVEKEIPDVSSLVKKTDYDAKISKTKNKVTNHDHDKHITTFNNFNNLTVKNFKARLAQAYLVTKADLDARLISLKLTQIKQNI